MYMSALNRDRAFEIYCAIVSDLGCKNTSEYEIRNSERGFPYPPRTVFNQDYGIKFSEVQKKLKLKVYQHKNFGYTKKDLLNLGLSFLKNNIENLSMVEFDSWFGRDITKYTSSMFGSWNNFKKELRDICLKRDIVRIPIHYRKEVKCHN